ncbi:MAG TPA: hypothetical protein VF506_10160 [Streptosporangiaceae bacterium]
MDTTLYERLGGTDAINTVAVAFESRCARAPAARVGTPAAI